MKKTTILIATIAFASITASAQRTAYAYAKMGATKTMASENVMPQQAQNYDIPDAHPFEMTFNGAHLHSKKTFSLSTPLTVAIVDEHNNPIRVWQKEFLTTVFMIDGLTPGRYTIMIDQPMPAAPDGIISEEIIFSVF